MRVCTILPLCALLGVAGCHGDAAPQQTVTHIAKKAHRARTPSEMTAGMVEAATVGKSTVPVALKFDLTSRPVVGKPLDVVLALTSQASGSASLKVSGSEGLAVPAAGADVDLASVDPTQAYKVTIPTVPTGEGVQLIGIEVTLSHDGVTEVRTFSLPLLVAGAPATAAPATASN
jgi:hypothetical protein